MPRNKSSRMDISIEISDINTGSAAVDGTLIAFFYAEEGSAVRSVTVRTCISEDGALELEVYDADRELIYAYTTRTRR